MESKKIENKKGIRGCETEYECREKRKGHRDKKDMRKKWSPEERKRDGDDSM